jgi:hypothetical protein
LFFKQNLAGSSKRDLVSRFQYECQLSCLF